MLIGDFFHGQGFDNYLKPPTAHTHKKKLDVTEADRLFSSSSATYQQVSETQIQDALDRLQTAVKSFYLLSSRCPYFSPTLHLITFSLLASTNSVEFSC